MRHFKRSLAATCILVPLAGMLSINCGLFTLPVTGPKALITNAQRIHFALDVVDTEGNPIPDVDVEAVKYSADSDLFFGEVEKAKGETKTVSGQFAFDAFGLYAAGVTISKAGYGQVRLLCANSDNVKRLPPPGLSMRMALPHDKIVNVDQYPNQRVVLSKIPQTQPTPAPPAPLP